MTKKKKPSGPTLEYHEPEDLGPSVTTASRPAEGLLYVTDPLSGEVKALPAEDARRRIFQEGWKPVEEKTAEEGLTNQELKANAGVGEGLLYGGVKGLSGGLADLLVTDPDAKQRLRSIEEGSPIAAGIGEVAGTVAPFALGGAGGAGRFLTFPGLADTAGQAVTRGLAGEAAGVGRQALARAAGMGLEGGAYGVAGELRRAHVDDSPLTAEKLAYGFMAGALPGAVLGAPLGAAEGLGLRFGAHGSPAREAIEKSGITPTDTENIASRDFGSAPKKHGLAVAMHSAVNPHIPVDELALLHDTGAVGEQVRLEHSPEGAILLQQSIDKTAKAMDVVEEAGAEFLSNWSARAKPRLMQRMMPGDISHTDVDAMIAKAVHAEEPVGVEGFVARAANDVTPGPANQNDFLHGVSPGIPANDVGAASAGARAPRAKAIEELADLTHRAIRKNKSEATELLAQLGTDVHGAKDRLMVSLANQDNNVTQALGDFLKRVDLSDAVGPATWRTEAQRLVGSLKGEGSEGAFGKELNELSAAERGYTGAKNGQLKDMYGLLNGVRKKIDTGTRAEVAEELDYLKKMIGVKAAKKEWPGIDDQFMSMTRRWYEDVRQNLENPLYWGHDFSSMQRETNSLLHKQMARKGPYWDVHFTDAGVPDPRNPYANAVRADPSKIRTAISKFNDPAHDAEFQMTMNHLKEGRNMVGLMRKNFQGDEAVYAKYEQALTEAEEGFKRSKELAMRQEQGKHLLDGLGGSGMTRGLIGYAIGGPVGAAASLVAGALMNPGRMVWARTQLERVLRTSESRIAKGVARLVLGATKGEIKGIRLGPIGATALAAKGTSMLARSLLSTKDPEKRAKEYHATLGELAEAVQPGKMDSVMREKLGPVGELVPNALTMAGVSYARAAQTVLDRAPVRATLGMFGEVNLPYVSDAELDTFEQVYRGALDPIGVLDAAADGELTGDMVDAADASAPALMGHIRELVTQAAMKNPDMGYEAKVSMSVLLRMPLDPSMTPEYIGAMQTFHRARFEEGYGPRSRRSFGETGANKEYGEAQSSAADKLESGEVPR